MVEVTAREKFQIGDRVAASADGMACRIFRRGKTGTTGVVVGFGRGVFLVRVKQDGIKGVSSFHASFWDVAPNDVG